MITSRPWLRFIEAGDELGGGGSAVGESSQSDAGSTVNGGADAEPDAAGDDKPDSEVSDPEGDSEDEGSDDTPAESDWKARSRQWESRAKRNHAKFKELQAEHADVLDKLQAVEDKLAKADTERLRMRIANEYGIDAAKAELLLTGGDEEAITAQAKALAEVSSQARPFGYNPNQGKGTGEQTPAVSARDRYQRAGHTLHDSKETTSKNL